jgi:hypothetical protein
MDPLSATASPALARPFDEHCIAAGSVVAARRDETHAVAVAHKAERVAPVFDFVVSVGPDETRWIWRQNSKGTFLFHPKHWLARAEDNRAMARNAKEPEDRRRLLKVHGDTIVWQRQPKTDNSGALADLK